MVVFTKLNNGTTENLFHISEISLDGTDVIYKSAKGSLGGDVEHFETVEEAQTRFEELKSMLVNEKSEE